MNKKAYTLIEVMLAISLSLMILFAVHLIPARILQSFGGYMGEVKINQTSQMLSSAITTDLATHFTIDDTPDGFKIGESQYVFDQSGVTRLIDTQAQQLTQTPVEFTLDDEFLYIASPEQMNYHAQIDLVFPLMHTSFEVEGETHE